MIWFSPVMTTVLGVGWSVHCSQQNCMQTPVQSFNLMAMQIRHKKIITMHVSVTLVKMVICTFITLLELSSFLTNVILPSSTVFSTEAPPPILLLLICKLYRPASLACFGVGVLFISL